MDQYCILVMALFSCNKILKEKYQYGRERIIKGIVVL